MAFYVTYFLPILMSIRVGDYVIKKNDPPPEEVEKIEQNTRSSLENKLINPEKDLEEESTREATEKEAKDIENESQITDN